MRLERGFRKIAIHGLPTQLEEESLRILAQGAQIVWFEQKELEEKPLAADYEALIVELDRCATDMMEAVRKSYAYMTENGFARGKV